MSFIVLNLLGFNTTQPYINVCAMDSREISVCGIINDLPKDEDAPKRGGTSMTGRIMDYLHYSSCISLVIWSFVMDLYKFGVATN